jgi:hypothetical protein
MQFQKVSIEIPAEVLTFYHWVLETQPQSIIAGGFLSDSYMGKPFQDVDIFVRHDPALNAQIIRQLTPYFLSSSEPLSIGYKYKFAVEVCNFEYAGYKFQLVFTTHGIRSAKYFDFRFREFFYFQDQSYASIEAIEDIKNKTLTFGVTKAPLVALHRLCKFKQRYGFDVAEIGFSRLQEFINGKQIIKLAFTDYLEGKVDSELQPAVREIVTWDKSHLCFTTPFSSKIKQLLDHLDHLHLPRDLVENIHTYAETIEEDRKSAVFEFKHNPYLTIKEEIEKEIYSEFQSNRLFVSIHFSKQFSQWDMFSRSLITGTDLIIQEVILRQWKEELNRHHHENFNDLFILLNKYEQLFYLLKEFKLSVEVITQAWITPYALFSISDFHAYLKGDLIQLQIGDHGFIIFDRARGKVKFNGIGNPYISNFMEETMLKESKKWF